MAVSVTTAPSSYAAVNISDSVSIFSSSLITEPPAEADTFTLKVSGTSLLPFPPPPQAANTSIAARLSDRVVNLFLKSPLIRSPFQPSSGEFLTGAYGPQFRVQRTGVPNVDAIAQANRDLAE